MCEILIRIEALMHVLRRDATKIIHYVTGCNTGGYYTVRSMRIRILVNPKPAKP